MRIEIESEGYAPPRLGLILLQALAIFLFCFLVLRLWYLQILRGEDFMAAANANRWKKENIYANRGLIFDDKGVILAENSPAYSVAVIRKDSPDVELSLAQASKLTGTPLEIVRKNYERGYKENSKSFVPLILVPSIDFGQLAKIEANSFTNQGLVILSRQRRFYTHGELFAHILGYVALANDNDLKTFSALDTGDTVGKTGLEVMLENRLRGIKGIIRIENDAHQRQLFKKIEQRPKGGEDIRLSLDLDLQVAATKAMGENAGCIVVMEPETGKLRALVTSPSYDNNIFTGRLSHAQWNELMNDPRTPLHNRVIQSVYPPGSVWKLSMTGLFLEKGIHPEESVVCTGSVTLGNRTFRCWNRHGHGRVNMAKALVLSCDTYFYLMGDRVGIDSITKYNEACGFGQLTGIDLPSEKKGLVPGREWKKSVFKKPADQKWQRGETYITSIGQGATLVTPVQMAVYVSALLNGGKLMKPLLVDSDEPVVRGEIPATKAQREFILSAMRQTVEDRQGTAKRILRNDAIMGGKTGTAQVIRQETRTHASALKYEHRDHGWMVTWGMKDGKTYVVVAMVEHGGGGSSAAGPVCAAVYNYLFGDMSGSANSASIAVTPEPLDDDAASEAAAASRALKAAEAWLQPDPQPLGATSL